MAFARHWKIPLRKSQIQVSEVSPGLGRFNPGHRQLLITDLISADRLIIRTFPDDRMRPSANGDNKWHALQARSPGELPCRPPYVHMTSPLPVRVGTQPNGMGLLRTEDEFAPRPANPNGSPHPLAPSRHSPCCTRPASILFHTRGRRG